METNDERREVYVALLDEARQHFPTDVAISKALGIGHGTMISRVKGGVVIRWESIWALRYIIDAVVTVDPFVKGMMKDVKERTL